MDNKSIQPQPEDKIIHTSEDFTSGRVSHTPQWQVDIMNSIETWQGNPYFYVDKEGNVRRQELLEQSG